MRCTSNQPLKATRTQHNDISQQRHATTPATCHTPTLCLPLCQWSPDDVHCAAKLTQPLLSLLTATHAYTVAVVRPPPSLPPSLPLQQQPASTSLPPSCYHCCVAAAAPASSGCLLLSSAATSGTVSRASSLAATIKSFSDSPLRSCVNNSIVTLFQPCVLFVCVWEGGGR